MKKILSLIILSAFIISVSSATLAAPVKKKTIKTKVKVSKPAPTPVAATPAPKAEVKSKILVIKGGLAGGACLVAADVLMPMGPVLVGGELGYAIGSNFGIIDAAVKVLYSLGAPFVGLEVGYAGYSKDVTNVPGLSGTIKSGVGVGLLGGTTMGPIQLEVGYHTLLGVRADAGYRIAF